MARRGVNLLALLRPHAAVLVVAFGAVLLQGLADLLEPWPLKVIFDYVLGGKTRPPWLVALLPADAAPTTVLDIAAAVVVLIAIVGALGSYTEKYLSTTVAKRVGYRASATCSTTTCSACRCLLRAPADRRHGRAADQRHRRGGGLHLLGGARHRPRLLTLVGMLGVMFYLDWRFSLIGLSVAPVLFVIVYRFTRRIKKAARDGQERKESELASVVQESISSVRVVQGVRAGGVRGTAARPAEPGKRRRSACARAASRRRSRRWSTSSSRSAPAWCCGSASASCCAAR